MKTRILLAAFLLTSFLFAGFAYRQAQPRVKWEYRVEFFGSISQKKLDEMGDEGWELVVAANDHGINEFVFKRQRQP